MSADEQALAEWDEARQVMADFGFGDWSLLQFVENAVVEFESSDSVEPCVGVVVDDLALARARRRHPASRRTRPAGAGA